MIEGMVGGAIEVVTACGILAVGATFIILACMAIYLLAVTLFFALIRALREIQSMHD